MAAPLFSKICMYRYWCEGAYFEAVEEVGGRWVGWEILARGEDGDR